MSKHTTSSTLRRKRICLFGTSANPPTGAGGHFGVIQALAELRKFDEVRILPVYRHTFASKRDQLLSFDHRVAMCELLVQGLQDQNSTTRVVVSKAEEGSFLRMLQVSKAVTDEEKAALRVGTADLLEMLMEDEQQQNKIESNAATKTEFSFCLGADTFMDLTDWKWRRSKDVLKLLEGRLVLVHRKQETGAGDSTALENSQQQQQKDLLRNRIDEINATPLGNGNVVLLDVPSLGDVSSSKIRNAENKEPVEHMLSPKVLEYVVANNLYGFGKTKKDDSIIG